VESDIRPRGVFPGEHHSAFTFVMYHVAYDRALESDLPHVGADVELEEGPRLATNIVGCRPAEVRCEMPVEVTWQDITGEFSLPEFKPRSQTI